MARGIVYILTNRALHTEDGEKLIKIGRTGDSIASLRQRISSLSSTGVPGRFNVYAAVSVKDGVKAEALLHEAFKHLRHGRRREFFKLKPEAAKAALQLTLVHGLGRGKHVKDLELYVKNPDDPRIAKTSPKHSKSGPSFSFLALGIRRGAVLSFYDEGGIGKRETAVVETDSRVRFRGVSDTTLSGATKLIYAEKGIKKMGSGTANWSFNGVRISDMIRDMKPKKRKKSKSEKNLGAVKKTKQRQTQKNAGSSGFLYRFSDLGIPLGAVLNFDDKKRPEIRETVVVVSDAKVKLRGMGGNATLSEAGKRIYARHKIKKTQSGPSIWSYKGVQISDMIKVVKEKKKSQKQPPVAETPPATLPEQAPKDF